MPLRNTITIAIAALLSLICYEKAWRNRYLSTIDLAMKIVENNYLEEVGSRELFENAMHGMLTGLDDYSDYIGPDYYEQFQETLDQEFVGIGVLVEGPPQSEELKIITPLYDSPAYEAGVRAGDVILEINGEPTTGMLLAQAVKKMKGPPQTTVTLRVRRSAADNGEEKLLTLTITRNVVQTRSVVGSHLGEDGEWDYFVPRNPRIGYLRITTFGEVSASELRDLLTFQDHPIDALILDLRGNVGGLLPAAVETCDLFIDEGVIVKTRSRHGWEDEFHASPETTVFDRAKPIAVLVDRYTASASEILAACLQDHDRAVLVGERTWGKGTVQNVIPLEHGKSALKLTTASYWRPSNRNIHRGRDATEEDDWGVRPDPGLEVRLTEEQSQQLYQQLRDVNILPSADIPASSDSAPPDSETPLEDPQLREAVDYLESMLTPATS